MLKYTLGVLFLLLHFSASAQRKSISGTIRDTNGSVLSSVSVMVYSPTDSVKPIVYTSSDDKGYYTLSFDNLKQLRLEFRAIGYTSLVDNISVSNNSRKYDATLLVSTTELKTVEIKANVYADTVKLKTSDMNLSQSSTLRKILEKSNGFDVGEGGSITFEGKPITKILVNKKEVFINQNSIALDNISYDMMEDVQLINNHKDKFKINFNNLKETVINVNTKKEFKGVFKSTEDLGYGYRNKFLVKGKGMFFSDKTNFFLTQNTNNTSNNEFKFEDLSLIYDLSSSFYKSAASSFLGSDNSLNHNFTNNTSLTFRKEDNKFKTGATFYYNYLNQNRSLSTQKSSENTLLNSASNSTTLNGGFYLGKGYFNYLLNPKTSLRYQIDLSYLKRDDLDSSTYVLYSDNPSISEELSQRNLTGKTFANKLELRSLLFPRLLSVTSINSLNEKTDYQYESHFRRQVNTISSLNNIAQKPDYKAGNYFVNSVLYYQISSLFAPSVGFEYKYVNEKLEVNESASANSKIMQGIDRKVHNTSLVIDLNGQNKKLEYQLKISPTITTVSPNNITYQVLPIESSLNYKIARNSSLNFSLNNRYTLTNLERRIDTLIQSYNQRLVGNEESGNMLTNRRDLNLGYFYNNVSASFAYDLRLSLGKTRNYLETIFNKIEETVFVYDLLRFDSKTDKKVIVGSSKGVYFSKKYHKIDFRPQLLWSKSEGPTFFRSSNVNYSTLVRRANLTIAFLPQNFLFQEASLRSVYLSSRTFYDQIEYNRQATFTNSFSLEFNKEDSYEYSLTLKSENYSIAGNSYKRLDLDVNGKYNLQKNLSLFVTGRSLLNLFNLTKNNISSLNVQVQDGLRTETINTSILGYMIFGLNIKL